MGEVAEYPVSCRLPMDNMTKKWINPYVTAGMSIYPRTNIAATVSVARTGLPHTRRTAPATQPPAGASGVAFDRTPSGNGHRHPTVLAPAAHQDRITDAEPDPTTVPNHRT
jgi:hypothetical protein